MGRIKLAIVGVGNCASSLVQGLEYYRDRAPDDLAGLIHPVIGGYRAQDIEVGETLFDEEVIVKGNVPEDVRTFLTPARRRVGGRFSA